MQAWLNLEYAHARGDELRAEAARMRLARTSERTARNGTRRRVARALVALGTIFVEAGNRVLGGGEVTADC